MATSASSPRWRRARTARTTARTTPRAYSLRTQLWPGPCPLGTPSRTSACRLRRSRSWCACLRRPTCATRSPRPSEESTSAQGGTSRRPERGNGEGPRRRSPPERNGEGPRSRSPRRPERNGEGPRSRSPSEAPRRCNVRRPARPTAMTGKHGFVSVRRRLQNSAVRVPGSATRRK